MPNCFCDSFRTVPKGTSWPLRCVSVDVWASGGGKLKWFSAWKMEGPTYKVEKAKGNQVISQKTSSGEAISIINHLEQRQSPVPEGN